MGEESSFAAEIERERDWTGLSQQDLYTNCDWYNNSNCWCCHLLLDKSKLGRAKEGKDFEVPLFGLNLHTIYHMFYFKRLPLFPHHKRYSMERENKTCAVTCFIYRLQN